MALVEKYVTAAATGGGDGSVGNPWTMEEACASAAAGDQVNILSGTYTRISTITCALSGTVGSPIIFRGVSSFAPLTPVAPSRVNQGWLNMAGAPVFDFTANFAYLKFSGKYVGVLGINFSAIATSTDAGLYFSGEGCFLRNSRVYSRDRGYSFSPVYADFIVSTCDFIIDGKTHDTACVYSPNGSKFFNCRFANNRANTVNGSLGGLAVVVNCVFDKTDGYHINTNNECTVLHNTFNGAGIASIATKNAAESSSQIISNNIFANTPYALKNLYEATAAHPVILENNLYYNVANAHLGFGDWPEYGRIDTATDPFVDAANGDFRLKRTSEAVNTATDGGDRGAIQRPAYWPSPSQLLDTATVDGITGNVILPPNINVYDYNYGPSGATAGTFNPANETDVLSGIEYANNTKTGRFVAASEDDVRLNTPTGIDGGVPGKLYLTTENNVRLGVGIGTDGDEIIGTLDAEGEDIAEAVWSSTTRELTTGPKDSEIDTLTEILTKIKAAVYDSANVDITGLVITLSNGTTITKDPYGRITVE